MFDMMHTILRCVSGCMFVITGGGSGLGRALALELVKRQQAVFIMGRHEESLRNTAQQSSLIEYCCADVSLASGRAKIADKLATQSQILGLIHNAGIIDPILPMAQIQETEWRACMATNVEAPIFLTQTLLPQLTNARVLHVGSGAAYFPIKGWGAYCTSKAALAMLTRCWQLDDPLLLMASVMPGIVDTAMQATIRHADYMDPEKHEFFCQLKKSGELLSTETVGAFLAWLLLDVSSEQYAAREWDIYDTSHHSLWLRSPNVVPTID